MGISTKLKLFSSFFIIIFLSGCAKEIIEENKIQTTVAAQLQNRQNIAYLSLLFDKIEYVLYVNDEKNNAPNQFTKLITEDENLRLYINEHLSINELKKVSLSDQDLYSYIIKSSYLNKKEKSVVVNNHRIKLLKLRYFVINEFIKSKTLKLSRVIEYYVAESLKLKLNKEQGYLEIKTNELPITRRVYNLILKRNPLKQKLRSSIGSGKKYMVTLLSPGNQIDYFECSENTYILDAAEEAGITLPFSSRAGADGASAGRIINGEVDQSDQSYLDDCQIDNGFVLLDVAYPRSNVSIRTHQEEDLNTNCLNGVNITAPYPSDGNGGFIPIDNGNDGDDGGNGDSGSGETSGNTTDGDTNKDIIDDVKNPCIKNALNLALSENAVNEIKTLFYDAFGSNKNYNVVFADGSFNTTTKDATTSTGLDPNTSIMTSTITFNTDVAGVRSEQYAVATIYHEMVHAELRKLFPESPLGKILVPPQHDYMAQNFVDKINTSLKSVFPNLSDTDAWALSWGGLKQTSFFDLLSDANKTMIGETLMKYSDKGRYDKLGSYCN